MGIILQILSKPRNWIIILILLLIGYGGWQKVRADKAEAQATENGKQRDEAINFANKKSEETVHYQNKFNDQVALTKHTEIGRDIALRVQELAWIKKFEGVKDNGKNLVSASTTEASISGESIGLKKINLDSLLALTDSLRNASLSSDEHWAFEWRIKDEYNDLYAIVLDTPRMHIRVPIQTVDYFKKKHKFIFKNWRWGKKEYFRESTSPNKLVTIESQAIYTIRKKK